MSPIIFLIVFPLGAAAISLWVDVRFPRLSPQDLKRVFLHVAASMVALHVTDGAIGFAQGSPSRTFIVVFVVALPALVYTFLAGLWTVKMMTGALGRSAR